MEDEGKYVTRREKWIGHLLSFDPEGELSDSGPSPSGAGLAAESQVILRPGWVVRKFIYSMKPSSSGHKFLWKYLRVHCFTCSYCSERRRDQELEMHRTFEYQD